MSLIIEGYINCCSYANRVFFFLEIIVIFSNQLNALWGTFVFYLSVYKLNNTVKIYTNTETELNFVFTVYYYIDDTILKCIK